HIVNLLLQPEIVNYYGFPSEVHHATTNDGYVLELHRIPNGKNGISAHPKPVVFLQHGFVGSSAVWITNLPNQSAGFLFADAGFDVWMGNVRGNVYSTKHVNYTRKNLKYWKFTFDKFAKYDLDTMINYVLNKTHQRILYYVGYSEGTLTMFAKLSTDHNFARKIAKFFALGPIGTLSHIKGLIDTAAKKFIRPLKFMTKFIGEFMPNKSIFQWITKSTCSLKNIVEYCESLMFQMTGPPTIEMNSRIPVYMSHLPAGTSMANVLHWTQMVNSGKAQMYDYGSEMENMKHYKSIRPPVYNLSLVSVPVYLYWSEKDWLADKRDVEVNLHPYITEFTQDGIIAVIPEEYLMQNKQLENFNHFDFIWGIHAAKEIYHDIIQIIREDLKIRRNHK
ncbi:unnamed protein product, partial [Thelazia callipaeda]|uniref:Lipase n=1 Tax=Thelazia callipaeda TaxID=103827 RepID=A0A0N5DC77_THECL